MAGSLDLLSIKVHDWILKGKLLRELKNWKEVTHFEY